MKYYEYIAILFLLLSIAAVTPRIAQAEFGEPTTIPLETIDASLSSGTPRTATVYSALAAFIGGVLILSGLIGLKPRPASRLPSPRVAIETMSKDLTPSIEPTPDRPYREAISRFRESLRDLRQMENHSFPSSHRS